MLCLIILSQTLKPAPTKLGDFLGQTLLTDLTKVWETPLNFDEPICIPNLKYPTEEYVEKATAVKESLFDVIPFLEE